MRMVILSAASQQAVRKPGLDAFSGKRHGAHISFASKDLLWQLLTAKRRDLPKAMTGGGPMTLRETGAPYRPRRKDRSRRCARVARRWGAEEKRGRHDRISFRCRPH